MLKYIVTTEISGNILHQYYIPLLAFEYLIDFILDPINPRVNVGNVVKSIKYSKDLLWEVIY